MLPGERGALSKRRGEKFLFCLSVICLGLKDILTNMDVFTYPLLAVMLLIPCLMIMYEISYRYISKDLLWIVGFVIVFYVAIVPLNMNGLMFFLPLILSAIAFRNINYNYIIQSFFIMQVLVLLIRFVLIQNDYIEVNYLYTDKTERGISYDFGYTNPNIMGSVVFFTLCCFYTLARKARALSFIVILIVSVFTYYYTASRTSLLSCILLLLTFFVPNAVLKRYIYHKVILCIIPMMVIALIFLSEYLVDNSDLNASMSGRIQILQLTMEMFTSPMTLLTGLQSDMVGDVDFPIDNAIAYLLCVGGIFAVLILIGRYLLLVKEKEYIPTSILTVIIVMFISGIGEKYIMSFSRMGGLLFWILLFNNTYRHKSVERELNKQKSLINSNNVSQSLYNCRHL